jgi:mono/diheme cytochrome c family protein
MKPSPDKKTKRTLKKIAAVAGGTVTLAVAALAIATAARVNRKLEAPYPDIHASRDPAVIERGHYLVRGPAHCADCHGAPDQRAALDAGKEIPLSGGFEFHLPVGTFRVPNITPDPETGTGRYSDGEIARVLRHGVHADGRMVLPFMPFADMSDDDLTAVISYLRTMPPVRHQVAPHSPNVLGQVVKAFVMKPKTPTGPVVKNVPAEPTVENGRYLANSVGNCAACHTRMDLRTGAAVGPLFGGGNVLESHSDPTKKFVTPNLTPHARWGWIASWPEEVFVARVHMGKQREHTPMPWHAFRGMHDDDLRAIYRYLRSLPPAEGGPDPGVQDAVVALAR